MKILFSAVGTEQPVKRRYNPETGEPLPETESALLRLCREELPTTICLYMDAAVYTAEQQTQAWENALSALGRELGTDFAVKAVALPETADAFAAGLRSALTDIRAAAPDSELLLDMISGTPEQQAIFSELLREPSLGLIGVPAEACPPADDPAVPEQYDALPSEYPDADFSELADEIPEIPNTEIPAEESLNEEAAETDAASELPSFEADSADFADEPQPEIPENADLADISAEAAPQIDTEQIAAEAVKVQNLSILKQLIDAYDYRAAKMLSTQMGDSIPECFSALLDAANLRAGGRFMDAQKKMQALGQNALMPSGSGAAEYYLLMQLSVKTGRYTEFLRSLQPYLLEILIAAVRKQFSMDVTQYMTYGTKRWDHGKLMIAQMTGKFKESFRYHTKPKPGTLGVYITTANLSNLMENLSVPKQHDQLILDTIKLRLEAEEKLRTLTGYSMQGATAQDIQTACQHTPEELLTILLNYTRNYTDIAIDDAYLASYDNMNGALKAML